MYGTALWATGVVLFAAGVLWLGAGLDNPLRIALILGGIALGAAFILWERRRRAASAETVRIERRPVTVALFVGLVIAIAQIVPMSQLPLYFGVGMGYGPVFGILALVPLFAALVVAGPVAGILLARFRPRLAHLRRDAGHRSGRSPRGCHDRPHHVVRRVHRPAAC